jgi:hypothetical protein
MARTKRAALEVGDIFNWDKRSADPIVLMVDEENAYFHKRLPGVRDSSFVRSYLPWHSHKKRANTREFLEALFLSELTNEDWV